MNIKPEDMLDTTNLKLEDVAKALSTDKSKDIIEDVEDEDYIDEDDIVDEEIVDEKTADEKTSEDDTEEKAKKDESEDDIVEDEEIEEDLENDKSDEEVLKGDDDLKDEPDLDSKKATEAQLSAFAEMKRQKKQAEAEAKEFKERFEKLNSEFAELAKQSGFEEIGSAEDYLRTLRNQRRTSEYKKTNDPTIIADMVADSLDQRQKQSTKENPENPKGTSEDLIDMILEFNSEGYGHQVKSIEDIASLPNAEQVIDLMGATYKDKDGNTKSLSLKDAYMIANKDTVVKSSKSSDTDKKAQQRAINKVKGHSHLKTTKKSGKVESIKVKRSELNKWLEMFPEKTQKQAMEEIKMYKKNGHEI